MSSHWRSSRWSSAREREEQERARQAATTTPRPSGSRSRRTTTPAPSTTPAPTSEIGSLISSSRERSKNRTRKWPYPDGTTTPAPTTTAAPSGRRRQSGARRTTTPRPAAATGGNSGLPPLPDEPTGGGGDRGGVPPRLLIIGAVLFVVMALLVVNPGDFIPGLGDNDAAPTATVESMIVPTTVNTRIPDEVSDQSTREPGASQANAGTRDEVICLDAGHGGWDTGFTRGANDRAPFLEEAPINLAMTYMLKERLEAEGFTVVLTRPSGGPVNVFNQDINGDGQVAEDVGRGANDQAGDRDELQARIDICNAADADILLSLHINGFDDEAARGYEVIYTLEREFGQQNTDLAFAMYNQLTAAYEEVGFDTTGRGAVADSAMGDGAQMHEGRVEDHYIMTGPAVNAADFSIRPSEMPGAILECGFISNDADAAFLAVPENQEVIVDAYLRGILDYFEQYPGKFQR